MLVMMMMIVGRLQWRDSKVGEEAAAVMGLGCPTTNTTTDTTKTTKTNTTNINTTTTKNNNIITTTTTSQACFDLTLIQKNSLHIGR